MIASANHTYVLADSAKFRQTGSVYFLKLEDVYQVITDSNIDLDEKDYLERQGIHITIA